MSRIGKLPIVLPKGVKVSAEAGVVSVDGPKGKLVQNYRPEVEIAVPSPIKWWCHVKRIPRWAGVIMVCIGQLLNNMIVGVSTGFSKRLQVNGVGYRAEVKGNNLLLNLGYSTSIEFVIPPDVKILCETPSLIVVSGIDKQRVGQVSSEIRSLRAPEPYKGKGNQV